VIRTLDAEGGEHEHGGRGGGTVGTHDDGFGSSMRAERFAVKRMSSRIRRRTES